MTSGAIQTTHLPPRIADMLANSNTHFWGGTLQPEMDASIKEERKLRTWKHLLFVHFSHQYTILYQLAESKEKKKDQTAFWNQIIAFLTDTTVLLSSIFPIKF